MLNRGVGGEDAPEMMKRLQTAVIDAKPDLVIWQVGTNAVLRNLDPVETQKQVDDGIGRIQAAGSDVVLVDPQYSPQVYQRAESANRMVRMLQKIAQLHHVGIFPRFDVMREWHDQQALPVDSFVIADGLHMNDWGYACFAQLLGDDIIKSVARSSSALTRLARRRNICRCEFRAFSNEVDTGSRKENASEQKARVLSVLIPSEPEEL